MVGKDKERIEKTVLLNSNRKNTVTRNNKGHKERGLCKTVKFVFLSI